MSFKEDFEHAFASQRKLMVEAARAFESGAAEKMNALIERFTKSEVVYNIATKASSDESYRTQLLAEAENNSTAKKILMGMPAGVWVMLCGIACLLAGAALVKVIGICLIVLGILMIVGTFSKASDDAFRMIDAF